MGISKSIHALLRRDSARHVVVPNRTIVAWWVGAQSYQAEATLKDISLSGALLVLTEDVTPAPAISIRIDSPFATDWAHATVIGRSTKSQVRLFRATIFTQFLRIKFDPACPFDFFKAATHGDAISESTTEHVSKEFDSRAWR